MDPIQQLDLMHALNCVFVALMCIGAAVTRQWCVYNIDRKDTRHMRMCMSSALVFLSAFCMLGIATGVILFQLIYRNPCTGCTQQTSDQTSDDMIVDTCFPVVFFGSLSECARCAQEPRPVCYQGKHYLAGLFFVVVSSGLMWNAWKSIERAARECNRKNVEYSCHQYESPPPPGHKHTGTK